MGIESGLGWEGSSWTRVVCSPHTTHRHDLNVSLCHLHPVLSLFRLTLFWAALRFLGPHMSSFCSFPRSNSKNLSSRKHSISINWKWALVLRVPMQRSIPPPIWYLHFPSYSSLCVHLVSSPCCGILKCRNLLWLTSCPWEHSAVSCA